MSGLSMETRLYPLVTYLAKAFVICGKSDLPMSNGYKRSLQLLSQATAVDRNSHSRSLNKSSTAQSCRGVEVRQIVAWMTQHLNRNGWKCPFSLHCTTWEISTYLTDAWESMSLGTLIVLHNEQELIKRQRGDGGFLVFVYLPDFDLQIRIDPNLFPMLMIQFSSSTFKELS